MAARSECVFLLCTVFTMVSVAGPEIRPAPEPEVVFRARTTVPGLVWIDRERGSVRGVTGEVLLDYRRGVLWVDAPKAKGAAGFLAAVSPFSLGGFDFTVGNDYAAVYLVSLDGADLAQSGHLLVQASTIARPYGFVERPEAIEIDGRSVDGFTITNLGSAPWNLERNEIVVDLGNRLISEAYQLDANGYPVKALPLEERAGGKRRLKFPEDALYVVLR